MMAMVGLWAYARQLAVPSGPVAHPVVCAWCKVYHPGKPANVTAWSTVAGSHGLCPDCDAIVRAENKLPPARTADTLPGRRLSLMPCKEHVVASGGAEPPGPEPCIPRTKTPPVGPGDSTPRSLIPKPGPAFSFPVSGHPARLHSPGNSEEAQRALRLLPSSEIAGAVGAPVGIS